MKFHRIFSLLIVQLPFSLQAFAGLSYSNVLHQVAAGATAVDGFGNGVLDGMGNPVDNSQGFTSAANAFTKAAGASIFMDPFFASPFASINANLSSDGFTYSSHADANANTGYLYTDPYFGGTLFSSAFAQSEFKFTVNTAATYHFTASTTLFSYFQFDEDNISLLVNNGTSGYDRDVYLSPGHSYHVALSGGASAQANTDFQFDARSNDVTATLTVPEPFSLALVSGLGLAVAKRRRQTR